jgi:flagellar motor switch protein FliG
MVAQPPSSPSQLNGIEKAAALLLMMGKDTAVKLADFFSPDDIRRLTDAASQFETLDPNLVEQLVEEFRKNYIAMGMFAEADSLNDLFSMKDRAAEEGSNASSDLMSSDAPDVPNDELEIKEITAMIDAEPSHLGAFMLSVLDDEKAAEVFMELNESKRRDYFKMHLNRKDIDPDISVLIKRELLAAIADKEDDSRDFSKVEDAAGIINLIPEEVGDELLEFVKGDDPDAAKVLKKSLFKFSAISGLPKETRGIIFDGVESDDVVKALGTADDVLKESVLEVMSQRNRRMIESELARGPSDEEVVLATQRKISAIVLRLAKDGKILLVSGEEE